jgi:hypothetical protein
MWSRGQTDDRSFTMPKSLSLEQGLDHHGAVERDERPASPRADVVDLPGDKLFARAAFTLDRAVVGHTGSRWTCRRTISDPEGGGGPNALQADFEGLLVCDGAGSSG